MTVTSQCCGNDTQAKEKWTKSLEKMMPSKCVYDMQSMPMKKFIELNQPEKQLPNNLSPIKKQKQQLFQQFCDFRMFGKCWREITKPNQRTIYTHVCRWACNRTIESQGNKKVQCYFNCINESSPLVKVGQSLCTCFGVFFFIVH